MLLLLSAILWCAWAGSLSLSDPRHDEPQAIDDDGQDAALQRVASEVLGGREGTIILMDAQTGRLRALVNPRQAFEQAASPGSTIKPFTTLAALSAGLIDERSRLLCRERYDTNDLHAHCSHPKAGAPFGPAQALAYSCNYYFARLGERTSEDSFNATLRAYGFGARTGASSDGLEAEGSLPVGRWHVENAIGESPKLQVTPAQLITAYAALFNGGHLYVPQAAPARGFNPRERATLSLPAPAHRALLLEGMRGAVTYGTAERARLDQLAALYIFGKTGTATARDGYTTDGWFIGFAATQNRGETSPPPSPGAVRLAVLVYLKRAHGAEAAELARPIFEEFERAAVGGKDADPRPLEIARRSPVSKSAERERVSVRLVSADRVETLSLEDYVLGVLAAEGSVEDEPEALKALAVSIRTYALKNQGRHAGEGFDFCSTTHCQRYVGAKGEVEGASELMRRAVAETAGEVLLDEQGRTADSYFSAACGGMTANVATLWGTHAAPTYLRGVTDPNCATMPHRDWTDVIASAQLLRALRSDSRTDVGARLDNISITRRDATGRAELLSLEGERRRVVRGWDFKIIVGRVLGWNILKSSRFEVTRAGTNYVFRGSGFGHGLGLCQEGAHVMARRGAYYRRILNYYFPGASVGSSSSSSSAPLASQPLLQNGMTGRSGETAAVTQRFSESTENDGAWRADVLTRERRHVSHGSTYTFLNPRVYTRPRDSVYGNRRLSLSSGHFRISYPAGVERGVVEAVLGTLEAARVDMSRRLAAASLSFAEPATVQLTIHETTGDFTATTGQPWWTAGVAKGARIELQPLEVLSRRGVLRTTLRHEYAHIIMEALGGDRPAPRWLAEGLAMHFAGEGARLARSMTKTGLSAAGIEERLAHPNSAQEARLLYAAAYGEVSALIRAKGEASVWLRIAHGKE
jgi:SpoIID/LytB domain protein